MKRILCYGDSNTWGQVPLPEFAKQRHPADQRWTGCLQQLSGESHLIIEEGLNGRTTGPEDPGREGRNGLSYLSPCLDSQVPLDLVIFMLGTNDLKKQFAPNPKTICERMRKMVQITKTLSWSKPGTPSEILVIAPVIPKREFVYEDFQYDELEQYAQETVDLYREMSAQEKVHFLNGSQFLEASPNDGAHLTGPIHQNFAKIVFFKIKSILG